MNDSSDDPSVDSGPQPRATTSINDLPPEILQKIFEHLHPLAPPSRTRWLLRNDAYAKALPVTKTELTNWNQHLAFFSVMLVSRNFFRNAMWLLTSKDWDTFSTDEMDACLFKVRRLRAQIRRELLGDWGSLWGEIRLSNAVWSKDACQEVVQRYKSKRYEEEMDR